MLHDDIEDAAIESYEASLSAAQARATIKRRLHARAPHDLTRIPQPQWLIPGLFQRKAIHIISAASGSGKSWLALQAMLAGATRSPILGTYPLERFDTLYLGADSPDWDLGNQLRQLELATGVTFPEHSDSLFLPYGLNLLDPGHIETLLEYIDATGIRMLVLDVMLYATQDVNENDNSDMARVFKALKLLRDKTSCAIVGLHHWKKGTEEARGAGTIVQAAEHTYIMRQGKDRTISLIRQKIRGEADWKELTIKLTPSANGGLSFCLAEPADSLLLTWFAFTPAMTRADLLTKASAAGYSAAWLTARLTEARRDGLLETDGKGTWKKVPCSP